MTKDVTLEKFLLVYFQEADNQTVQDVMDALFTKPDLRDEWQEIVDILEALKSPIPTPSESSLKIIMEKIKNNKKRIKLNLGPNPNATRAPNTQRQRLHRKRTGFYFEVFKYLAN